MLYYIVPLAVMLESRGGSARGAVVRRGLRRMSLLFGVGVEQWWCVCVCAVEAVC